MDPWKRTNSSLVSWAIGHPKGFGFGPGSWNSCLAWQWSHQRAQCTTCSDFFAPLVVFIDSTPVDMYGKVNVEPIMFIRRWFKREVCKKAQSWHPLGFVADTKVKSSAQNPTGKYANKDYHMQSSKWSSKMLQQCILQVDFIISSASMVDTLM